MFDHLAACRKQDLLSYSSTTARLTLSSGVIRNESPAQKGTIMNPTRYRVIPVSMAVGMGVARMRGGRRQRRILLPPGKTMGAYPTDAASRHGRESAHSTLKTP